MSDPKTGIGRLSAYGASCNEWCGGGRKSGCARFTPTTTPLITRAAKLRAMHQSHEKSSGSLIFALSFGIVRQTS